MKLNLSIKNIVLPLLAIVISFTAMAQNARTISGTVSDSKGEAVIGANVVIKGTTNGTTTDANGAFKLQAPANATLIISYIGYTSQEVPIAGKQLLNIVLAEDVMTIEKMVVVGYGTQRKETLTGSVASVKGVDIVKSPAPNVSSSLSGKLPGLIVNQRSGEPGRDDPTILVRGFGTFGDSAPLVIIDGVERSDMSRMNPEDIESITVLKDASAAIYGARAANGVILITTKKGEVGKTTFIFNTNRAFSSPTKIANMLDSPTFAMAYNEGDWYRKGRPASYTPVYSDEVIRKFRDGSDPILYPNTNWVKEAMKPYSIQTRTNLQASGGSEAARYLISLGALTQGSGMRALDEKNNQYTARVNVVANLSKNLIFGANISAIIKDQQYSPIETLINFTNILQASPTLVARYPNGLLAGGRLGESPLLLNQRGYRTIESAPIYSTFTATYSVPWVKGLKLDASFNYDMNNQHERLYNKPYYFYDYNTQTHEFDRMKGTGTSTTELTDTESRWSTMMYNLRLAYEKKVGDHQVGLMLGKEQQINKYSYVMAYRKNFITTTIDQINVGGTAAEDKNNGGSASKTARDNYFGRFNYSFNSKYLVEMLFRYDGSQNFPSETRYGFFPAASVGWRLSEEPFIKNNLTFIDQLKLRASAGQTGNDRVAAYQFLQAYSFGGNYVFGKSDASGIYANMMPNPNITWEKSTKYDVGFDASVLNGLLGMEVTLFRENRTDILAKRNLSVPGTLGFSDLPDENIGKVKNQGVEVRLTHRKDFKKLTYSIEASASYAKNEIIYMDEVPNSEAYQNKTGRPVNANLYYQAIGIFHTQAELDAYPHHSSSQVGDLRIKDYNNDGKIDSDDSYRFDYTSTPRAVFGLTGFVRFARVDLSIFFQGQTGAYNYDDQFSMLGGSDPKNSFVVRAKNRWTATNPKGTMPRADAYQPGNTTFFLYDASFVRLKTLELGYTLPTSITSRLKLGDVRFYASGFNLLTWAKEITWVDPEISGNSLYYPQQRVFNMGVNVKF